MNLNHMNMNSIVLSHWTWTYLVEIQPLPQTASDPSDEEFTSLLLLNLLKRDTPHIFKQLVDVEVHLV